MTFPNNGTGAATDGGQTGTTTDPAAPPTGNAQPPTPPAPANGQQQDSGQTTPPKPGPPPNAEKTFTQADLDRILNERLSRQEKSLGDKLAALFGNKSTEGDGTVKPEDVLKRAEDMLTTARTTANTATAEALAQAAGIKPERIATFIGLANLTGALQGVDQNDAAAVKTAIKTAIDAKAAEFPEWKTTTAAPASGGDRSAAAGGKKTYTRADLASMSDNELADNADEILAAQREGRIVG
ncbi:hypothetical protein [Amycolatopsis sp. BJA-103]|uniref:hypothetical protein n=1 Tax=Amycolatopsis sp. BJA-103 TaxID=1911175 RepID=UPI000C77E5E8|nr:hypothetical protein [Amycolatopsis sp. BJA-103]AUI56791.1 hypothetical protein BKN51_00230 [Amycolatopsis sp. BJA-103]PNE13112.1 hypothetical protein B1H26_42370 [Amycolatopsis sp. BJA-103]